MTKFTFNRSIHGRHSLTSRSCVFAVTGDLSPFYGRSMPLALKMAEYYINSTLSKYNNHIRITQPSAKYMYLIATFAYGELHQAYGHVTYDKTLTRAGRKDLATETNKSAIKDHVAKENRVIDWSGAKILDREGHRRTRQLQESIRIRKEANCMNRDAGVYNLPTTYDRILVTRSSSASRDHMPDEVRRWRTKRRN